MKMRDCPSECGTVDTYELACCDISFTADIGVRDGAPFGQFVDINSGRESTLFGQNTIHV